MERRNGSRRGVASRHSSKRDVSWQQVKVLRMRVCHWAATGSPVQARQFQEFEIELPDETRTIMHEDGLGSRPSSLGSSVSGPP
jgi:hypothetical protein